MKNREHLHPADRLNQLRLLQHLSLVRRPVCRASSQQQGCLLWDEASTRLEPPFVGESVDFKTSQTAFVPCNSTTPTFTPLHPSRLKFRSFGTEWKDIDVSAAEKLQTFTVETENSLKPADQLDKLLKTVYQICSSFFEETKRNLPRKQKSREEVILDQEKHECRLEMKQLRRELRKSGPSIENAVKWKEARTRMKRIF